MMIVKYAASTLLNDDVMPQHAFDSRQHRCDDYISKFSTKINDRTACGALIYYMMVAYIAGCYARRLLGSSILAH